MYKGFFKIQFSCIGIKIYKLNIMTTTFSSEYFSIKTRNALNRACPQKKGKEEGPESGIKGIWKTNIKKMA